MPQDPLFEQRLHDALLAEGVEAQPKKMFGGVAFMVNGNMSVGITNKGYFMVRIDPDRQEEFLALPGARPMDFTHRPMKGFLFVDNEAVKDRKALQQWVRRSLDFVLRKPAKKAVKKVATKRTAGGRK